MERVGQLVDEPRKDDRRVAAEHASLGRIPCAVALYAVNIWLRFSDPSSLAVGIGLSAIGLGALSASSWLGDERIRVYKE